jgi:polar amino acid transport system substrate-binding protein
VDAYFGDAPVAAYYIEKDPSSFSIGGTPVNPISIGIAILKSDTELQAAVKQAVSAMYADGTMDKILTKWKLGKAVEKLK